MGHNAAMRHAQYRARGEGEQLQQRKLAVAAVKVQMGTGTANRLSTAAILGLGRSGKIEEKVEWSGVVGLPLNLGRPNVRPSSDLEMFALALPSRYKEGEQREGGRRKTSS